MTEVQHRTAVLGPPPAQGLYDPRCEHDACGVGFVVDIKGRRSHTIVRQALQVLINLLHRGACGCEANTGDGAGVLLQVPDKFLRRECDRLGIPLPPPKEDGRGIVLLPRDPEQRDRVRALLPSIVDEEGQRLVGWREVPTDDHLIGASALSVEPHITQVLIGRGPAVRDHAHFERKLYVIRKLFEKAVVALDIPENTFAYMPSLSSNTLIYKGMLSADQIETMYPDLRDPDIESALALVHQRFSTNTFPSWPLAHPYRYVAHNGEINTLRGNINWMRAREALCRSDVLDRNGLRPSRYYVTKNDLVVMASEVGVLDIPPDQVLVKERLHPGRIFLVDTAQGRIIDDDEIKAQLAAEHPYGDWLQQNQVRLEDVAAAPVTESDHATVLTRQMAFGYTHEDLRLLLAPMAKNGEGPIGSMGTDTALAVLSERPRPLYDYFQQLFAQVTNPPLDQIREELVTAMESTIGPEGDLLAAEPGSCRQIVLKDPVLSNEDLAQLAHVSELGFKAVTLAMLYPASDGATGLERALEALQRQASRAVADGHNVVILSDRGVSRTPAAIPSLLATAAVHHHLVRHGERTRCGLVVETGDAREVHPMCLLIGYGAGAVNPWVAFETLDDLIQEGVLAGLDRAKAVKNYIKALNKGILKVMAKMGISTL